MAQDLANFIGLNYAPGGRGGLGFDCWGFVRYAARGLYGQDLPDYLTAYDDSENHPSVALAIWAATDGAAAQWDRIRDPEPGDAVTFRIGRFACHVGLHVGGGDFLHCMKGRGSCLENIRDVNWQDRVLGHWRFQANG